MLNLEKIIVCAVFMLACISLFAASGSDANDEENPANGLEQLNLPKPDPTATTPLLSPAPLPPRDTGIGVVSY